MANLGVSQNNTTCRPQVVAESMVSVNCREPEQTAGKSHSGVVPYKKIYQKFAPKNKCNNKKLASTTA